MRLIRWYSVLPRPNLDLKSIIAKQHLYHESIIKRESPDLLNNLQFVLENRPVEIDKAHQLNSLRHKRSTLSKTINKQNKQIVIAELSELKKTIKQLESEVDTLSSHILASAESLPNLIDDSVKHQEEIVQLINCQVEPQALENDDEANVYDHKTIAERKGIVEFEQAAKISGSSWYYLKGDGALLENALVQYGLAQALKAGYEFVIPPMIVKNEVIGACGFKPRDQNNEQQIYEISDSDTSLIGTSEIPLAGLHCNTIFPQSESFPKKYVGISRAFRAEAGSRGKDTKGLYRVHEFTKLELFHFTRPDSSGSELEDLIKFQTQLITDLGLKAKVINIPFNDLGAPAFKKYDIEAWMPGRNKWGELTSSSNCTDYQARRLNIRFTEDDKSLHYVHTLNGTAMAVPRVIVAIIEQNYDPQTGKIKIPDVLVPFMGKHYI